MLDFKPKGAIFDVDDTLLDNKGSTPNGLHERSRYAAVHEVGQKHKIPELINWTYEQNFHAFHDAPTHSLLGAFWNTLVISGLRSGDVPDPVDPLIKELIEVKMRMHEDILLKEGEAFPGAIQFVADLANSGLRDRLAIATTAYPRDLNIFLHKTGLDKYFPKHRIISNDDAERPKPDPEAYNLAFDTLSLPESDRRYVVAFEDNPRGIKSAQGAGLFVCALTHIFSRKELEALKPAPAVVVNNFAELSRIFGLQN